jgi:sodium ion-translocating decarboxylase beta subunit
MRWTRTRILLAAAVGAVMLGLPGILQRAFSAGDDPAHGATGQVVTPAGLPEQAGPVGDGISLAQGVRSVIGHTGIRAFVFGGRWKALLMIAVGFALLYLGAARDFEPLLLIPIGFGTILVNVPFAGMGDAHGLLGIVFRLGIQNELLPLVIFMCIGAMSDFGPLLASPRVAILGAAAQFGVFGTLMGVVALDALPFFDFSIKEACAIAVIGAADGPTSIYVASIFAPHMLGSIAVAAYSYMALVPLIQPPIMRLLTTEEERRIPMRQVRPVSRLERVMFPLLVMSLCVLLLPAAIPLMGCFAFGNFVRECGAVERLSRAFQNEVMNVATIFLGLGVGMQMAGDQFVQAQTLGILVLGLLAFSLGTAGGVVFAKIMNLLSPHNRVNPLIGSAGVSAFPMAARVSNKMGLEADPHNFLLMHALGANVAGQIGSVVAAGVILAIFGR